MRNTKLRSLVVICFFLLNNVTAQDFRWGASLPEEEGFSTEAVYRLRDTLRLHGTKSLLIIRNDRIIMEWYAEGWNPNRLHYTASLAKALAGGMSLLLALNDGKMNIDDPAWKYIPQWKYDPQKSKITIRMLATHSSGLSDAEVSQMELNEAKAKGIELKTSHMEIEGWKGDFWRQVPDPFTIARDKASVLFAPGSAYHYSNPGFAMLAYAVTSAYKAGEYKEIRSLLQSKIMEPVGINREEWNIGYDKTFSVDDLELVPVWGGGNFTPRAVARIARLMLRKGNWEGQQLIDSSWIEMVTKYASTPVETGTEKNPSIANGLPWYVNENAMWPMLPRDAFMGTGAGNQLLLVIPSLNLIAVRNGDDMYNPSEGEGFYYGIIRYLIDPLMKAFTEAPYPQSGQIKGIKFSPVDSIQRQACGSDNWPLTWGDDDNIYTAYGDGRGFEPLVEKKLSLGLAYITGAPPDITGYNIHTSSGKQYGDGRAGKKASSLLMVNKILYMWVRNSNQDGKGSQLAWSEDHGRSWKYAGWNFDESFGYPVFLNFGKNYQGARDRYVYIFSHDDPDAYLPADRMVLARVPLKSITERDTYEFFAGFDGIGTPVWSSQIGNRGSVFTHPAMCYRGSITYNPGLKKYLWCQVHPDIYNAGDPRVKGGFGIYESTEPWGPWRTVFYTRDWDTGPGETSSFPARWMSKDGRTCYLVFSGNDCFSIRKSVFSVND